MEPLAQALTSAIHTVAGLSRLLDGDPLFQGAHGRPRGGQPHIAPRLSRLASMLCSMAGPITKALAALASAYGFAGQAADARREMARLEELSHTRYVPALYFAMVHNSLGESAKALKFGWDAASERSDYLVYLRLEPQVGKLAGDTRFLSLLGSLHR